MALNHGEDGALQRLIAAATGRLAQPEAPRGGVMRLSRKSGKPDFALACAPHHGDAFSAETAPAAFILITDAASCAPKPLLRELFGLTEAEGRVAERLMQGDTPEQAAIMLGVKTSTARWHLASLYRKTGTSRQAQLVRLLMSVPRI
jgi:DNA-binding CsgD family transcriptional regulator